VPKMCIRVKTQIVASNCAQHGNVPGTFHLNEM
jgi:hypothetical protein